MATSPVDDIGPRKYDPEFLKSLASPPKPKQAELPVAWRRVVPKTSGVMPASVTTPRATMWQRLSSLFTSEAPSPKVERGSYEVTLDLSKQVLHLDVLRAFGHDLRAVAQEALLFPSFAEASVDPSEFAPAAALALKAKQFDDGLYASVELAADAGLGRFHGKRDFVLALLQTLVAESDRTAASILTAAARLDGKHPQVPAEVAEEAEALLQKFLGNELESKVLGFYTWSEELARIFRRDRMLQTEIGEPTAREFVHALARNEELLRAYDWNLSLAERLTNMLARDDLRELAATLKEGRVPIFSEHMSLFPPSRAHETDLVNRLYGDRPIPEGFSLADEIIKRVRDGSLDLAPTPGSGWYDHQTHALEPLVAPKRMPEAAWLSFDESYCKELHGLFRALLALTRETHIKQVEGLILGALPGWWPVRQTKPRLLISPGLTLEPLATYYLRRARSYRFVRQVLEQAFGAHVLEQVQRLTADGPVNLPLGEELRLMQAIFRGAYFQVCAEIGIAPEPGEVAGSPDDKNGDPAVLRAWLASVRKDPDLGKDVRMMVPIFYDLVRKKIKVWVVVGVASKPLTVSYANPPEIKEIKDPWGRILRPNELEVEFIPDFHESAYFATAEVYVTRLLDRTEFRKHCDQHTTFKAILSNLE